MKRLIWLAAAQLAAQIAPVPQPLADKMRETTWRQGCPVPIEDLRAVTTPYTDFDGKPATGVLVVHKEVAKEVAAIFRDMHKSGFRIRSIKPVEEFGGSDDASMSANNTSAFNCRDVAGKPGTFSNHSWGRAIDINPLTNPYVRGTHVSPPEGRAFLDRTKDAPGLIRDDDAVVRRFKKSGWKWGGDWVELKDYQHFEKPER
jgi:hypothetical protein